MSTNNDRSGNNSSISESEIQMKLYGGLKKEPEKKKDQKSKISESTIKDKLYGDIKAPQKENTAAEKKTNAVPEKKAANVPENDLFAPKPAVQKETPVSVPANDDTQSAALQVEIDALKQAIENLEEKLNRTESQKHKLKVKLVQKRKLINVRERIADIVLNQMPEKIILVVTILAVALLIMLFIRLNPKSSQETDITKKESVMPEQKKEKKPLVQQVKPQPVPVENNREQKTSADIAEPAKSEVSTARYTIQAAEYADEQAAMAFVKELEAKGFEVFINTLYRGSNNTRPYFKINVGSFETFDQAKNFNQEFRKKTNINDSFIRKTRD